MPPPRSRFTRQQRIWQSVVKVPSSTETAEASALQGARREHAGCIRPL